jgi:hypothetical protein
MELTQIEIWQGTFSSLYVLISIILAIAILVKYFDTRSNELILMSVSIIAICFSWMPDAINFLLILLTGSHLSIAVYFLIGFAFLPILIFCWLILFTNFAFKDQQKIILIIFIVCNIFYEVLFFYFLFNNIEELGVYRTPFQVEFGIFMEIYLVSMVGLVFVTGMIFSYKSLKRDEPDIKLRGKMIFLGFLSFTIGAALDSTLGAVNPILIVFIRIFLILSSILFYLAFILPEWFKKIFLKK